MGFFPAPRTEARPELPIGSSGRLTSRAEVTTTTFTPRQCRMGRADGLVVLASRGCSEDSRRAPGEHSPGQRAISSSSDASAIGRENGPSPVMVDTLR